MGGRGRHPIRLHHADELHAGGGLLQRRGFQAESHLGFRRQLEVHAVRFRAGAGPDVRRFGLAAGDLPHDYGITQKYSQSNEAESAYLPGGTGWYRKSFTIDRDLAGKRIAINFDGVYMNATVWFNGVKLGTHPYGYSPFSFDLTGNAKFGEENTIVVKVENRLPSSRWYSGSGIYRDVTLTVTDGVHVGNNGVAIKTPSLATQNGGNVTMNLTTKGANDTEAAANITLKQTGFP